MRTRHAGSFLLALALLSGCATLADTETGGENLPNAAAGPFRALRVGELGNLRSAPNALEDDETFPRDPAVLDVDGDPVTPAVFGYFSMTPEVPGQDPDPAAPPGAIVRHGAEDGRSFDRMPLVVLTPEEPWEGGTVGAPSVVRVDGEVFLYYAAAGGIGLARSPDGAVFTRVQGPVFGPDAAGWEAGAVPRSPGVVVLDDGSLRLFYEVPGPGDAARIGEARSNDGITWTRVGDGPALAPAPAGEGAEPPYDGAWVGAPAPVLVRSTEGRSILRVYHAARDTLGKAVVGLAARFDPASAAPLQRAVSPVFGSGSSLGPHEPCALVRPGYTLLFTTQRAGRTKSANYPAVAAGVAPADVILPAP
ncbi:hypothetical protein [Polyangium sorediatum]|uniref:Uncharacterized protein n=1 Tax=Polyangium sorediatum TaxID=889274 RepID=A0ABT6NS24_9BACT|nr:hypothetical protein [Polyangium sorediatum]MDI1431136.1 hypothetical protein [Polyangium sorediatum]